MFVTALVLVALFIPLKLHSNLSEATPNFTAYESLTDTSGVFQKIEAIREIAIKYLIDENHLIQTLKCESSLKHTGVYGDLGKAYGWAQFHKPTFDEFCKGDYYNIKDQLKCMGEMISNGLVGHWTCWKDYFSD